MKHSLRTLFFRLLLPFLVLFFIIQAHSIAYCKTPVQEDAMMSHSRNLLHLHFDKHDYKAGETIWFKAYLVDSRTQIFDIQPANLYVELFDFAGEEILSKIFRLEKGMANGDIKLDQNIPDGNYMIRAFTNPMLNYGEEFLFKKYLYISNPEFSKRISKQEMKENMLFNAELELLNKNLVLEVYPEGGNLLSGIRNNLMIYLANGLGIGIPASGNITDESGEKLVSFSTNELGYTSFTLTPQVGVQYVAVIEDQNGQTISKDLSPVINTGVNLNFNRFSSDSLYLDIWSVGLTGKELMLEIYKDGSPIFSQAVRMKNEMESIGISVIDFPPGVVYFELLDHQGSKLSYRPVFIEKRDQPFVALNARGFQYENHRAMSINLNISDEDGKSVPGELSVSVLAGDIPATTRDYSIFSNIMFLSEQAGTRDFLIRSDQYPFAEFLDLQHLFLISGKYPFYSTLNSGQRKQILKAFEPVYGINIRGVVTDPDTKQPAPSVKITLSSRIGTERNYDAFTDEKGLFEFRQLELQDSALVDMNVQSVFGGTLPKIDLITDDKKQTSYHKTFFTQKQGIVEKGKNWKKTRRSGTSGQSGQASIYGNPDQSIIVGDKVVYYSMMQLLEQRASGLMISGNSIMFRGPGSINLGNDPLFIVENIAVSRDEFLRVDPGSVQRIELFKGTSSAFFGSRGANGVIVTYLKKGDEIVKPFQEFVVKGFSSPNEYFFDKNYLNKKFEKGEVATVLWEPFLISDENGHVNLHFLLIPGVNKYKIVVQRISKRGGVFSGQFILGK